MAEQEGKDLKRLDEVLKQYEGKKGTLIPILQKTQDIYGYLPKDVLVYIAQKMQLPISQIYGVVTFYAQFHLEPRGKNIVRCCQGTACHVRGAGAVIDEVRKILGLKEKEVTTEDLQFTLETVACIGCCGLAPVIMVNEDTHGRLTPESVHAVIEKYKS